MRPPPPMGLTKQSVLIQMMCPPALPAIVMQTQMHVHRAALKHM